MTGAYNVQAAMDREIAAAAGHGVDFFSILWYYPQPGSGKEAEAERLNRGLQTCLASTNAGLMRFMVECPGRVQGLAARRLGLLSALKV